MRQKSEERKEKIISAIEVFYLSHRRAPTITELVELAGLSRSRVHAYLRELDREGRIRYDGRHLETPVTRKASLEVELSPILGAVACGQPQYAEENFESYVALPTVIFGGEPHFVLRAHGDSMIEAGIEDGDLVVIRKQNTAREGEIVVALVDNQTTLKRFFLDQERCQVRLHPENREMVDLYVDHCYIQGVAQNVIKRLT